MALYNGNINISYECSELIEELKKDIAEFGGETELQVVIEEKCGVTIYKDYNFHDEETTDIGFELSPTEKVVTITALELLFKYEKENSIF